MSWPSARRTMSVAESRSDAGGYDVLASFLKAKMADMMTPATFKILFGFLGINLDKPTGATVLNSAAYRAVALRLDVWALAPEAVSKLYLEHFQALMVASRHRRFNLLRTFRKASLVRKMLFTLKSQSYNAGVLGNYISESSRIPCPPRTNA